METPMVTIVLPAYNVEAVIDRCLRSVAALDYPKDRLEVIVVDNESSDATAAIVRQYPVRSVHSTAKTIGAVRNAGAALATGDIIGFVDSDCELDTKWLREVVRLISRPEVAATGGGYSLPADATWVEKAWLCETRIEERIVSFLPAGNMAVRADVYREVGGFDEALATCEDADFCERVRSRGYLVMNSSRVRSVHLRSPKTLRAFFQKEIWYGEGMISASNRKFDKVLLATLMVVCLHGLLVLTPLTAVPWWVPAGAIILVLCAATCNRIVLSRKYRLFFQTSIVYYVYFIARAFGMAKTCLLRRP